MRACAKCGVYKDEDKFRLRKSTATGKHYRGKVCNACHQALAVEWKKANPLKANGYRIKSYRKNVEARRLAGRENHFKRKFGISIAERNNMLEGQGGVCAICSIDKVSGKGWCVDHDHKTGKIRGIVCSSCNVAIGHMKDNPELLRRAALYIEGHR